jgi:Flp pilus assembly protein TadD
MWKSRKPAAAIALALGFSGCTNLESPFSLASGPGDPFSRPSVIADKGEIANEMRLADASLQAGNAAAAISIYRRLAREYPLSLKPRIALGEALLAANAPQEAARAFEGALKLRGDSYAALTGLGRVELALHQPAEALEHFNKAAAIAPKDTAAQNGRAVALDQLGRHEEAQALYLSLLAKEPSNIRIRNNYALSLALAGKYDDSADILSGLAAAPDAETRIRQNLALVYGLSGNDGQAAHVARMDLDEEAVANNLQYYQRLRHTTSDISKGAALLNPASGSIGSPEPREATPAPNSAAEGSGDTSREIATQVRRSAPISARSARDMSRMLGNGIDDQITDENLASSAAAPAAPAEKAPGNPPDVPAVSGLGEGVTGALGQAADAYPRPQSAARQSAVPRPHIKASAPHPIPSLRRAAAPPPTG